MAQDITFAGEQLFTTQAQLNQALDIDTFIFANVPGQDPTAAIDRNEGLPPVAQRVHTQAVQQKGKINDNIVVYSTVLESITGPFEFNWVGLYSSVHQTLIAVQHIPTVNKTTTVGGAAGNTLNRNFGIEYSGIAALTEITVDAQTWQLDFTARLAGMDKLTQQLAKDMNGRDWFIDDGFEVYPRTTLNTFGVRAGAAYVSGLRVEIENEPVLIADSYPKNVYVDAWFDGDASSTWQPLHEISITSNEINDYVDESGKQHYVLKIATLNSANDIADLRETEGPDKKINEHLEIGGHNAEKIKTKKSTVQSELDYYDSLQDWYSNAIDLLPDVEREIFFRRPSGANKDLSIYLNHEKNAYQNWNMTKGPNGFDNNVETHENGNMWMLNTVSSSLVGPVDKIIGSSNEIEKVGSWIVYGDVITSNDLFGNITAEVKGTDIFLNFVGKSDGGIASIYIDDEFITNLDMYTTSVAGQNIIEAVIRGLTDEIHNVKVYVTGSKNDNSDGFKIRVESVIGVGLPSYDLMDEVEVFQNPMQNGSSKFKIGYAASEIAIQTTVNGNSEWSGSYHKNCYPRAENNDEIYVDGKLVDYSLLQENKMYKANKIMLVQKLALSNGLVEFADLNMVHTFTSKGCNVKWSLIWKEAVTVNRFYQAMWPCDVDTILFGNSQKKAKAKKDNNYVMLGGVDTLNAICWNSENSWVSGIKSRNEYAMQFKSDDDSYYGMYAWDRPSDFKIYLRKFKGQSVIGERLNSDVDYFIAKQNSIDDIYDLEVL